MLSSRSTTWRSIGIGAVLDGGGDRAAVLHTVWAAARWWGVKGKMGERVLSGLVSSVTNRSISIVWFPRFWVNNGCCGSGRIGGLGGTLVSGRGDGGEIKDAAV